MSKETVEQRLARLEKSHLELKAAFQQRREPAEKQFRQAEAVATITARLLLLVGIPADLVEEWKTQVIEGTDREGIQRAAGPILGDLAALRAQMDARLADGP